MLNKKLIPICLIFLLISITLTLTPIISAEEEVDLDTTENMKIALENNPNEIVLQDRIINTGSGLTIKVDPLIVYGK